MFPNLGIDRRLTKDPLWLNVLTGQTLRTGQVHHSAVFKADPAILGFTPEELASKFTNTDTDWTLDNVRTTQIIRAGWCRIDRLGGDDVCLIAGDIDRAWGALTQLASVGFEKINRLTVFVIPSAVYTPDQCQLFRLAGDEIEAARKTGFAQWARPEIAAVAPRPKMRSGASGPGKARSPSQQTPQRREGIVRRCPFSPQ